MLFAFAVRPFTETVTFASGARPADERAGRTRVQRDAIGQPDGGDELRA